MSRTHKRFRFTREGRIFSLVTVGVGIGAVNTGNNLLFLVLGMLLGMILISGILSEWNLWRLDCTRTVPERAIENEPFSVSLCLINQKKKTAAFAVELRDRIDGVPFKRRCFFLRVDAADKREIAYRGEVFRRGTAIFNGTLVSTRFPFGLFEKTRYCRIESQLLVWPCPISVEIPKDFGMRAQGVAPQHSLSAGAEFYQLRPFETGDDPRRIHWRSTARQGRFIATDTRGEVRPIVEIVLDGAWHKSESAQDAEMRIRAAGTVIREMAGQSSTVRLVTAGPTENRIVVSESTEELMDALALLSPEQMRDWPPPCSTIPGALLIGNRIGSDTGGHRVRIAPPSRT